MVYVLLFNIIICTRLYGLKLLIMVILGKSFDSSIWSINGTHTGTTTASQSGPGSNGNAVYPESV